MRHRLAQRILVATLAAVGIGSALADGKHSEAKRILQIESQGSRAFAGTKVFNPADPSGSRYLACDHGIVDAVNVPNPSRREPPPMTQFCDSQAEKSVNFLY